MSLPPLPKRKLYSKAYYFLGIEDVIEKAVNRIKEAYHFSLSLGLGKLYVCFSGGKDSVAVYGLCKRAFGDNLFDFCEFHYNMTGIDHPELVRFIKTEFPFVERHLYKKSMWKLIEENGYPPTRLSRYCCAKLKEGGGEGRFCLTGVRWAESSRRTLTRGEFESFGSSPVDKRILNADNDEDRRELEHCIPKRKYICNPIVDWSEECVWRFIVEDNLPYCNLYDKGFNRLGCIGCPMDTNRGEVLDMYPKYKEQYLRTFDKMLETRRRKGLKTSWNNAQEVYDWWISG